MDVARAARAGNLKASRSEIGTDQAASVTKSRGPGVQRVAQDLSVKVDGKELSKRGRLES